MTIRELAWGDFAALVENYFALYDEVHDHPDLGIPLFPERPSLGEEAEWFVGLYRGVEEGSAVAAVAEEGGRAVGLCNVNRKGAHREGRHIGVLGIAIARPWRRKGIGRQLLRFAIERCRPKFELVELTVFASNTHARDLYASLGFVPWGVEPKGVKRDGRYTDVVHMSLDLARLNSA